MRGVSKRFTVFVRLWLPLIIYMGLMWYVSSRPIEPIPLFEIPFADKIAHLFEYGIFGVLVTRALFSEKKPTNSTIRIIIVVMSALVWGGIDEIHQSFIPTRDPNIFDLITDCIGAGAGTVIMNRYFQN